MPVRRHPVALPPQKNASPESLAAVPLDVALVTSLRASYEMVRAHDLRLAEIFYARLFAAAPHLRSLFRGDPAVQAAKLMAALDVVVKNLDAGTANAAMLAELGRRHASYGARPEHYPLVVDLLVGAMQTLLGPSFLPENREQWRLALSLVCRQMVAASEGDADRRLPGP
jgi:hemoglobin-like flavoprotein